MMACTSSIGPGATNMVTAAAVAHVDRLPLLTGDHSHMNTVAEIHTVDELADTILALRAER